MSELRLTPKAANQLMSLWLDDSKINRAPIELFTELKVGCLPVYWKQLVRTFLAERSPKANDYLWDNDLLAASKELVDVGLSFKILRRAKFPSKSVKGGRGRRGAIVNTIGSSRLSGQHSAPWHDWHYVK